MTRILYLVHDLADPAVQKRVAMLQAGGASVRVAGFRRGDREIACVSGVAPVDLGRTFNGGFVQRSLATLRLAAGIRKLRPLFANVDVIIARNLEMLAIGVRGRAALAPAAALVYESLDIHRLLLRSDALGKALRALEGWLARRAALLLTSSPAFIEHYFKPLSAVRLPIELVENKVFAGEETAPALSIERPDGPPWRIGWFGAIRCRKSLALLRELATRLEGKVDIILRGKPAYDVFDDFEAQVRSTPHLRFMGPYKNPDDLAQIYGEVHFTWAIDLFEEGRNSSWLLPNRIYEGGRYGAVPIALHDVEIGRLIGSLGIGVPLKVLTVDELVAFFTSLTSFEYRRLAQTAMSVPAPRWTATTADCRALVKLLSDLKGPAA